jgi:PPOX class probable F420-dependent enzyme
MTEIPSSHHDLLESQVATLATIGPDGGPQQTEIWFINDGDSIVLSLNETRQKVKNLVARPQFSFLIVDPASSQRYLELRGDAHITPDTDGSIGDRVTEKYGVDVRGYDAPGTKRVAVRFNLQRVNAVDMRG